METPNLEWESEESKKQREIREANRAMDARAEACFERSWEEDPSVHHDHDSSERPFRLRGNAVSEDNVQSAGAAPPRNHSQNRQNGQPPRRKHAGQQQRPRRNPAVKPQLRESVRSAPESRSEKKQRLAAFRRIRIYLLAAAVILLILGIVFVHAFRTESAAPQEQSSTVTETTQRGDDLLHEA